MTKILVGIVAAAMVSTPALAADVKWDLATEYNQQHFVAGGYEAFAETLKKRSNGKMEIFIQWGGALGYKSADHLTAVGGGAVQIADTSSSFLSGFNPLFSLSSLPFVAATIGEARTLHEISKPYYDQLFRKQKQILLASVPFPPTGIWSKKPLNALADIKNLKIRSYDVMGHRTFTAAGALPIQVSFPDMLPQLAAGAIEAVLTSGTGGASLKFWEHANRFTELNYAFPLQMLHVNADAFNGLSPELQQAVVEASKALEDFDWRTVEENLRKTYADIRANGATVVEVPPPDLQKGLAKAADGVINEWVEKSGTDAKTIMAEFRKRTGR